MNPANTFLTTPKDPRYDVVMEDKKQRIFEFECEVKLDEIREYTKYDSKTVGFYWRVPKFLSSIKKVKSPVFEVDDKKWRVILHPNYNSSEYVSAFLEVYDSENLSNGWARYARYQFTLVHQSENEKNISRNTNKRFNFHVPDWGFREFFRRSNVEASSDVTGLDYLMKDESFIIQIIINVSNDKHLVDPLNYDSKSETGFIGLKNQGCTCYLNSLLQTLFHITEFRKLVYSIPVTNLNNLSLVLALQKVFFRLQFGKSSVNTIELTRSFGWDTLDSFMQHDIQELTDILFDRLEKTKKKITELCRGTSKGYIKCINVEFESARDDIFTSICLNVKGMGNIINAFKKYCEEELLNGENQYNTGNKDLKYQDAKRGIIFKKFPKMLMILLKRYDYNLLTGEQYKINERFEYYDEIDLNDFIEKTENTPKNDEENKFVLFSVLVHQGGISGGHYYSIIKIGGNQWYRFDDERVYRVYQYNAIEENFGGGNSRKMPFWKQSELDVSTSAYVLYYLQKTEAKKLVAQLTEGEWGQNIGNYLGKMYEEEINEEKRKDRERREAHLRVTVRVCTIQEIMEGKDEDVIDMDKVRTFCASKKMKLGEFKKVVAKKVGIKVEEQERYWKFIERRNRTFRPSEAIVFETALDGHNLMRVFGLPLEEENTRLDLFVESKQAPMERGQNVDLTRDVIDITKGPTFTLNSCLLFFKYYSPKHRILKMMGSYVVDGTTRLNQMLQIFNNFTPKDDMDIDILDGLKSMEIDDDDDDVIFQKPFPYLVCEEVSRYKAVRMISYKTLVEQKTGSGDILVFQRKLTRQQIGLYEYPEIPDYYQFLRYKIKVTFKNIKQTTHNFSLDMITTMNFNDVRKIVAQKLNSGAGKKVVYENIQLTGHNAYMGCALGEPFKLSEKLTLNDMLMGERKFSSVLYFDVLKESLKEFEKKKKFEVFFYENGKYSGKVHQCCYKLTDRNSVVLNDLKEVFKIPPDVPVRLMEVFNCAITRQVDVEKTVKQIQRNPSTALRMEVIPLEQRAKNVSLNDDFIKVIHFDSDSSDVQLFGNPFILKYGKDETVGSIRKRIGKYLDDEVDPMKVNLIPICSFKRYNLLKDETVLFKEMEVLRGQLDFDIDLGIQHRDKTKKKNNTGSWNKGIEIIEIKD